MSNLLKKINTRNNFISKNKLFQQYDMDEFETEKFIHIYMENKHVFNIDIQKNKDLKKILPKICEILNMYISNKYTQLKYAKLFLHFLTDQSKYITKKKSLDIHGKIENLDKIIYQTFHKIEYGKDNITIGKIKWCCLKLKNKI